MVLTIKQLAERIGADLVGDESVKINAVGAVETANGDAITFITDEKHIPKLEKSLAGGVIVEKCIEGLAKPQLIVKNVDAALIKALNIFAPKLKPPSEGIDPGAHVSPTAKIAKGVSIGQGVVIDDGVEIGENTVIAGGCKIGQNSKVGEQCRLDSNVVIYHNCTIGKNVIIQANSTIGSTGFGYRFIDGAHRLIPHNGGVIIEDFVEIGANCCVDRAKFGNTIIGAGTKIDNLVQIAHNVVIGKCCLIVSQVGISGSCKLGDGVVLAGQVGLVDNIEIGAGAIVGAQAGVTHNVAAMQQMFGSPATLKNEAIKAMILTRRLPKMSEQLKQLLARIEKLEAAKNNKE
jgi:UDP-3-O-[3-hydroxymyristoyl] glucosamine N-acyltransferase